MSLAQRVVTCDGTLQQINRIWIALLLEGYVLR